MIIVQLFTIVPGNVVYILDYLRISIRRHPDFALTRKNVVGVCAYITGREQRMSVETISKYVGLML